MQKRYFSLEEAERLIPKVNKSISKLKDLVKAIGLLGSIELNSEDHFSNIINEIRINKTYHKLNYLFFKEITVLLNNGIIIKDIKEGIVDFYSIFEGREIFLCWRFDEKDIKYWHETSAGFDSRKPIALLRDKSHS